jgi:dTDP-4-dehydrorhamnose reductase
VRILITGATGYLGRRLVTRATAAGHDVVGTSRSLGLDIRERTNVLSFIDSARPDAVIHTASARADWAVMADGAANVAAAVPAGVRLVHVSSDAVFAGRAASSGRAAQSGRGDSSGRDDSSGSADEYDESEMPDPVYRYGAAKAAGETAVRALHPGAAVVRTSLILGGDGQHETLVHDLIGGRIDGHLFTDMVRKPVHADDLADALLELAGSGYAGILNVAGPDPVNRYDLGVRIAARDGLDPAALKAAGVAELGLRLPTDVRLNIDRARSLLRTRLRGVDEFLPAGTR